MDDPQDTTRSPRTAARGVFRSAVALLLGGIAVLVPGGEAGAATNAVVLSSEVYTTSTGCSNTAALRSQADALDGPWRADAAADSYEIGTIGSGTATNPTPNPTPITFVGTPLVINVSKQDVASADVLSTADNSWGTVDTASSSDPSLATSATLQDCGPRPTRLYASSSSARPVLWNATAGDGSTLDAVLFEFSTPVAAFGAWFGDVESSADGTLAQVKLFDDTGAVISVTPLVPDRAAPLAGDPSGRTTCGGVSGSDALACGNQATRFVGFSFDSAIVAKMMVVVGDDDSCVELPSGCGGEAEHLSFIGPQIGIFDSPVVTTTTTEATTTTTTQATTTTTEATTSSTEAATSTTGTPTTPAPTTTSAAPTPTASPTTLAVALPAVTEPPVAAPVLPVTGNESVKVVVVGLALILLGQLLALAGARVRSSN